MPPFRFPPCLPHLAVPAQVLLEFDLPHLVERNGFLLVVEVRPQRLQRGQVVAPEEVGHLARLLDFDSEGLECQAAGHSALEQMAPSVTGLCVKATFAGLTRRQTRATGRDQETAMTSDPPARPLSLAPRPGRTKHGLVDSPRHA